MSNACQIIVAMENQKGKKYREEKLFYPTVVTEINDHQNPCKEPSMNGRGNSSLFQCVSYKYQKKTTQKKIIRLLFRTTRNGRFCQGGWQQIAMATLSSAGE